MSSSGGKYFTETKEEWLTEAIIKLNILCISNSHWFYFYWFLLLLSPIFESIAGQDGTLCTALHRVIMIVHVYTCL